MYNYGILEPSFFNNIKEEKEKFLLIEDIFKYLNNGHNLNKQEYKLCLLHQNKENGPFCLIEYQVNEAKNFLASNHGSKTKNIWYLIEKEILKRITGTC